MLEVVFAVPGRYGAEMEGREDAAREVEMEVKAEAKVGDGEEECVKGSVDKRMA